MTMPLPSGNVSCFVVSYRTHVYFQILLEAFGTVDDLYNRVGPRVLDESSSKLEHLLKHADHKVAVQDV